MGGSCTKSSNDIVEDKARNPKRNAYTEKNKEAPISPVDQKGIEENTTAKPAPPDTIPSKVIVPATERFDVIHEIEALQHTMKPTVSVVPSSLLHPSFRQFTPMFAEGTAALSVASCKNANAPQQVLVGGEDCSIALLNYETGHVIRRWVHAHGRDVNVITRPLKNGCFATGSRDKAVKVWSLTQDDSIADLEGHSLNVTSVDMHPDSTLVVSGSKDNTVRLWDVNRKEELYCGDIKLNLVHFVRFVPTVNCVAQGGEDLTLRLWDVRSGAGGKDLSLSCTLEGLDYYPTCCEIVESQPHCILTGHNGVNGCGSYICEWDLRMQKCLRMYLGHKETVTALRGGSSFYGTDRFFSVSQDNVIGSWHLEKDASVEEVHRPEANGVSVLEGRMTSMECEENGDLITTHASGCVVVYRPLGKDSVPSQRYRYIGVMPENCAS
ncbi:WD repeat domain 31 [Strigomonas culicis]|uniref:WD repeat domain 31 n=2 Tax=Strigomonas culicis TaxID=28005 RepID=S9VZ48_9TRYP|nr:WD repeat domain 31 [Strigomonas culicis]EPY28980.1 WD repeat domain 31 [Strigomonas culicis]|eukprot:EPY25797.1 WD repeat domain 31 [Strigomonas culicis]